MGFFCGIFDSALSVIDLEYRFILGGHKGVDTGRLSGCELLGLAVRAGLNVLPDMREHLRPEIAAANFPPCAPEVEVARRSVDMTVP